MLTINNICCILNKKGEDMKYLLTALLFLGCAKETQTVRVEADNSRVEALERSLQVNYQNDALLAARVTALENAQTNANNTHILLQSEIDALEAQMNTASASQQQALQAEINARIAADNALQAQLNALSQLLNSSMTQLNVTVNNYINNGNANQQALDSLIASLANLTQRVTLLEQNGATDQELQDLRLYVNNNFATISMFQALQNQVSNLNTQVVTLNNTVTNLQTIINGSAMTMVKAPCSNSKEYFIKTNGKFYGAMNMYGQCNELEKVYLAELASNTLYQTTDGTACKFKVINGNLVQQ